MKKQFSQKATILRGWHHPQDNLDIQVNFSNVV